MPCTLSAALADAAVCRGSFHAVLRTDVPDAVFAAFSAAKPTCFSTPRG